MKHAIALMLLVLGIFDSSEIIHAGPITYTFQTINLPGAGSTGLSDINDAGQIVGYATNANPAREHGFVYSDGTFTSLDLPGANPVFTYPHGINDSGQIVGSYNQIHGFLYTNGVTTNIDFPGSGDTDALGINNAGQIVGIYYDPSLGMPAGFLYSHGIFKTITIPGASYAIAFAINDIGQVVGDYIDAVGSGHAFLYQNGS